MTLETLPLTGVVDETRAIDIARVLNAVNGVSKIAFSTADNSVSVEFNDGLTSVQELRAVLQKAGFGKAAKHGEEGVCCGSCGS